MLTADELAQLRADVLPSLPDLCDVIRSTRQADGRGGQTTVWAAVTEDVPCRIAPTMGTGGANEEVLGARITAQSDWVLTLPWDTEVTVKDRIRMPASARTYEIKGIADGRSWQISLLVGLVELA